MASVSLDGILVSEILLPPTGTEEAASSISSAALKCEHAQEGKKSFASRCGWDIILVIAIQTVCDAKVFPGKMLWQLRVSLGDQSQRHGTSDRQSGLIASGLRLQIHGDSVRE